MSLSSSLASSFTMNNGLLHPKLSFGVYKIGYVPSSSSSASSTSSSSSLPTNSRSTKDILIDAIRTYPMLDCAEFYNNEVQVGEAISHCLSSNLISRSNLFVATKVWTTTIYEGREAVISQVKKSIADLQCSHLDLVNVHWPVPNKHVEAYRALEHCVELGLVKSIGLSNYSIEDYEELMQSEKKIKIKPVVNQIEINPFLWRGVTVDYFRGKGVVLESYRTLCDGKRFDDETILKMAAKYEKSSAQILGRFCVQQDIVPILKSVKLERMVENSQIENFEIEEADMDELRALTTEENKAKFLALYRKCVNRDTPKDGTMDGVKDKITVD
ncbi:hypothetical protein ScalyP_jg2006 [Parmales sp. scaly parma]|nr:hypothetical protein ScalyP_jg2006 [Parmales sp. scaly parma]